jgi:aspartate dehydrogenase
MTHRSRLPRIGLIGFGAIARLVVKGLDRTVPRAEIAAVLVRPERATETRAALPGTIAVVSQASRLAVLELDLVVECAGHQAVVQYGQTVVRMGVDLMIVATGALADDDFRSALTSAAREAGARIFVPAGAIAGIDGLNALRLGGLDRVRYTSAKPVEAWRGTPAEGRVDLDRLTGPAVIFQGPARVAAKLFPKNANLAATIALAGCGFDETEITLVADPALRENVGRIEAEGSFGQLFVELRGQATVGNPKTSAVTAFSILHAIENRTGTLFI